MLAIVWMVLFIERMCWYRRVNGVVQPVGEIGRLCKEKGIYFHCDAVQGLAWIKADVRELGIDLAGKNDVQDGARRERGGLWADAKRIPPWEWRKGRRE